MTADPTADLLAAVNRHEAVTDGYWKAFADLKATHRLQLLDRLGFALLGVAAWAVELVSRLIRRTRG